MLEQQGRTSRIAHHHGLRAALLSLGTALVTLSAPIAHAAPQAWAPLASPVAAPGADPFYTAPSDAELQAAQPGDVLQYGADGEWKHSVLVTEVVNDANGQPVEFLIASNTTDRIDWPMSAYAYADVRLIHVLGYNN